MKEFKVKILITGSTGFLGLELTRKLSLDGHEILGLVRNETTEIRKEQMQSFGGKAVKIDYKNLGTLNLLRSNSIDLVIHTATSYGRQGENLSEIFQSNLVLPLQILKEIREGDKRIAFVNVDSFFNKSGNIYSPLIDYSLSKKSLLDWLIYFSDFMPVINMRLEHMYGPGDKETKLIPFLVNELSTRTTTEIKLSPGTQTRDFIHVSDISDAFVILIRGIESHIENGFTEYQIGTGVCTSIRELVLLMKHQSGSKAFLNFGSIPFGHKEIMSSVADSRFSQKFDWMYRYSLEDGIADLFASI